PASEGADEGGLSSRPTGASGRTVATTVSSGWPPAVARRERPRKSSMACVRSARGTIEPPRGAQGERGRKFLRRNGVRSEAGAPEGLIWLRRQGSARRLPPAPTRRYGRKQSETRGLYRNFDTIAMLAVPRRWALAVESWSKTEMAGDGQCLQALRVSESCNIS